MKYGLKENTINQINSVFARYPQVKKVILYGSRAKGNYKTGSDIDLTLIGGDDLTLNTLYRIIDDIDDLLLPYTIDLSIYKLINNTEVLEHIQLVGVVFYEKNEELIHH